MPEPENSTPFILTLTQDEYFQYYLLSTKTLPRPRSHSHRMNVFDQEEIVATLIFDSASDAQEVWDNIVENLGS